MRSDELKIYLLERKLNSTNQTVEEVKKTPSGIKGDKGDKPIKNVDYFDGKDGKDGLNGYTPIKGVDYTDGLNGYTPIKGVDYFDGINGKSIELQKNSTHIQWRQTEGTWNNLVLLSELQGTPGTAGTGNYTINVQALTSSPVDGQTVYFGMLPKAPITSAGTSKIYIRNSGTIKIAEIYCYSGTAGTNQNWSLYIRKNNTTDYLISTLAVATNERVFSNASLNIPVISGDYIEIKGIQPTWTTNPATTIYGGYILIER